MIQAILFILLISAGIGIPLTLLIAPKHNTIGRIGISYLVGIGFFTLVMFVTNILGLKFSLLNTILIFLVLSLPLVLLSFGRIKKYFSDISNSRRKLHLDKLEKLTLSAILFFVISSFVNTLYWPVYIWDALTMYDFRGRIFAQAGFAVKSLQEIGGGYYLGYPLFTSLSHAIIYLVGGGNPQFIYSLFYLALGLVFYGQLREFLSRKSSMMFTLLLLVIPQVFNQSLVSYTNLPYTVYFGLGAIYFYIWHKKMSPGYLALSAAFIGLSTWARSTEPFWLGILAVVILSSIIRKRYLEIFFYSIVFFPIQQVWKYILGHLAVWQSSTISEVSGYTAVLKNILNIDRWGQVIGFLYKNIICNWGVMFILFITIFIYSVIAKKIKETYLIYVIIFILLAMLFIGNFVFSYTFPAWNAIPDSASRMAMVFYPLFIYSIALLLPIVRDEK